MVDFNPFFQDYYPMWESECPTQESQAVLKNIDQRSAERFVEMPITHLFGPDVLNTTPHAIDVLVGIGRDQRRMQIEKSDLMIRLGERRFSTTPYPAPPYTYTEMMMMNGAVDTVPVFTTTYVKGWDDTALARDLRDHYPDARVLIVSMPLGEYFALHPDDVPTQIQRVLGVDSGAGAIRTAGAIVGTRGFIQYFDRSAE